MLGVDLVPTRKGASNHRAGDAARRPQMHDELQMETGFSDGGGERNRHCERQPLCSLLRLAGQGSSQFHPHIYFDMARNTHRHTLL